MSVHSQCLIKDDMTFVKSKIQLFDQNTLQIISSLSTFATNKIKSNLFNMDILSVWNIKNIHFIHIASDSAMVRYLDGIYRCDCIFYQQYILPCKHLFALMKKSHITPDALCKGRWFSNKLKKTIFLTDTDQLNPIPNFPIQDITNSISNPSIPDTINSTPNSPIQDIINSIPNSPSQHISNPLSENSIISLPNIELNTTLKKSHLKSNFVRNNELCNKILKTLNSLGGHQYNSLYTNLDHLIKKYENNHEY